MNKKGFTLVEVIVSIVLVSVIMVSMLASLVKLRDTYSVIHENSDVIVYTSSIARVINNDLMKNNGIRYANCSPDGLECELILGNDEKRKIEILKEGEEIDLCDYRNRRGKDASHERITTTLKYTNTTNLGTEGDLIYIRTLILDRYTEYSSCQQGTDTSDCAVNLKDENCKMGTVTTKGYNFYDMNVPDPNLYYGSNNLVDTISKVNIRIWDGKNEESTKYDIVLYSSGRYDDSELVGNTYKIALDTNGATTSGTVELDEVFGVAYFDGEKSHSSKNIIRKISKPTKVENGKPMAFLGYYYYKGSADTLGTQIIDSKGTIVASSRVFRNDIELKNLEGLSETEKQAHERVVAMWEECAGGYKVVDGECVPETYIVTLDKNGGTGGRDSYTATYMSLVPDIALNGLPTRKGYKFTGYYDGSTEYNDESGKGKKIYNRTNGITITAGWNANTFTVKYNENNGLGSMNSHDCTYDQECSLSGNGYARSGHIFKGWKKSNTGDIKQPGDSIKNVVESGNVTYYAQWQACGPGTYANGNECTSCPANTYSSGTANVSCEACPNGYTTDGSGKQNRTDCKITCNQDTRVASVDATCTSCNTGYGISQHTIPAGSTSNACGAKVFEVTLNKHGGSDGTNTIYEKYDTGWYSNLAATSSISSITVPTKANYTFNGYFTSETGGTKIINNDGSIVSGKTKQFTAAGTLHAQWTASTITCHKDYDSCDDYYSYLAYYNSSTGLYEGCAHLEAAAVPPKDGKCTNRVLKNGVCCPAGYTYVSNGGCFSVIDHKNACSDGNDVNGRCEKTFDQVTCPSGWNPN